jgi:hypothetical protein
MLADEARENYRPRSPTEEDHHPVLSRVSDRLVDVEIWLPVVARPHVPRSICTPVAREPEKAIVRVWSASSDDFERRPLARSDESAPRTVDDSCFAEEPSGKEAPARFAP